MCYMITDTAVAAGTWVLAGATWWLARNTLSTGKEQHQIQLSTAAEQRKLQLYLELRKEFDSPPLRNARSLFARQLLDCRPHNEMQQEILTFFEDMGMLVRRNYLDREMVWDTFGYLAKMWWSACKEYIATEKSYLDDNPFAFADFTYLVDQIYQDDVRKLRKSRAELEPIPSKVKLFLETEAGCRGSGGAKSPRVAAAPVPG
jgi:hypothetical protein